MKYEFDCRLTVYVYEYLHHVGATNAATLFLKEVSGVSVTQAYLHLTLQAMARLFIVLSSRKLC